MSKLEMCILKIETCLLHSDFVCCISKTYKSSGSSQILRHTKFYMHDVKTCKNCQRTYENMEKFYARAIRVDNALISLEEFKRIIY